VIVHYSLSRVRERAGERVEVKGLYNSNKAVIFHALSLTVSRKRERE
jgi:hypothetical protein